MYLVTGGAGFIGSHTVDALIGGGRSVRVLDDLSTGQRSHLLGKPVDLVLGDICDPVVVAQAMQGCTHVIHLAAKVSVPDSCADPLGYHQTNERGALVVLEAARDAGVRRVVLASSCSVYGSILSPEGIMREGDPLAPESPYAASKACNEMHAVGYTRSLGLSCTALRYFNVFGTRQDAHGAYGAVIPRFVEAALEGRDLTVYGDGEQGRDFVSVRDIARANVMASRERRASGRVYNIGTQRMLTVNHLAKVVLEVVGSSSKVVHVDPRPGDVRFACSDSALAHRELGWRAQENFEVALCRTVEWFRDRALG